MKTKYHANAILQQLVTDGAWLGFLHSEPESSTVYDEVTGTGYARGEITFSEPLEGRIENTNNIEVGGNLLNQVVQYVGVFSAATSGRLLRYYRVSGDEWIVGTTDPLVIDSGSLIIRES